MYRRTWYNSLAWWAVLSLNGTVLRHSTEGPVGPVGAHYSYGEGEGEPAELSTKAAIDFSLTSPKRWGPEGEGEGRTLD